MDQSDDPAPANVEQAGRADAGDPVDQESERSRSSQAASLPDYDDREANLSETRKPMGPELDFGDDAGPAALEDSRDDEPPVDPA